MYLFIQIRNCNIASGAFAVCAGLCILSTYPTQPAQFSRRIPSRLRWRLAFTSLLAHGVEASRNITFAKRCAATSHGYTTTTPTLSRRCAPCLCSNFYITRECEIGEILFMKQSARRARYEIHEETSSSYVIWRDNVALGRALTLSIDKTAHRQVRKNNCVCTPYPDRLVGALENRYHLACISVHAITTAYYMSVSRANTTFARLFLYPWMHFKKQSEDKFRYVYYEYKLTQFLQ